MAPDEKENNMSIPRNAGLAELVTALQDEHARKLDIVAPASQIRSVGGVLEVVGAEPVLTADGVTSANGRYLPTAVCDEGLAGKLNIPLSYIRKMRAERPDMFDQNINSWLHGNQWANVEGDSRSFMVRCLKPQGATTVGVARAFLSDRYALIDNLDVLTASLDGVRQAGIETKIQACDLTDRRMYVRVFSEDIAELAPELLAGYRSPFDGATGSDNPTVFAGFEISNSETGGGAFTITPRLVVQVCNNGMKVTKDAIRSVHLGGKQDQGLIEWSKETNQKQLELVTAKTADAVRTFMNREYMVKVIRETNEKAGVRLTDSAEVIKTVTKKLAFSEDVQKGVFDHFIQGGQVTAGGVFQAFTSFAQTVGDADLAADIEGSAFRALDLAAAAS